MAGLPVGLQGKSPAGITEITLEPVPEFLEKQPGVASVIMDCVLGIEPGLGLPKSIF